MKAVVAMRVAVATLVTAMFSQWLIQAGFWWAFILYGAGIGLLTGALVKIKNSLASIVGSWLALLTTMAMIWREQVAWFTALLFATFVITIIGFIKYLIGKTFKDRVVATKAAMRR